MKSDRWPNGTVCEMYISAEELSIMRSALDTYYMAQMTDASDTPASRARLLKTGEMLKQLPKEPS